MHPLFIAGSLAFAAALPTGPSSAPAPKSGSETTLRLPSNAFLVAGMTREAVVDQFGEPDEKLTADLWVYWNIKPKDRPAGEKNDALLVAFAGGRVVRLRLTAKAPLVALLEQQRAKAARAAVAAK